MHSMAYAITNHQLPSSRDALHYVLRDVEV